MYKVIAMSLAAATATSLAGYAVAGPDRVAFPDDYADRFVLYNTVDRPDRNTVRFMYANPDTHAEAMAGEPAPEGTILVMEDHAARLDASGAAERGPDGRMIPTDEVTNVFVMETRPGWGEAYPPETRNGDWDYAWYLPDGSPKPDASFDGCFSCHQNRADRDFNFTYFKYLMDREGM